jgi:hypothetical protein
MPRAAEYYIESDGLQFTDASMTTLTALIGAFLVTIAW